jgi:hypothetical protein
MSWKVTDPMSERMQLVGAVHQGRADCGVRCEGAINLWRGRRGRSR